MLSPKPKADPRRVVCQCQSHGCYKSFYIDAHGNSQQGVEVLPATKESHTRADLRSQIESTSAGAIEHQSSSTESPSVDQTDQLVAHLTRLGLGSSRNSKERNPAVNTMNRSVSAPTHHLLLNQPQNDQLCEPSTSNSKEPGQNMEETSPSSHIRSDIPPVTPSRNKPPFLDPDVCNAADSARQNGLRQYDTNRFHDFTLSSFNPVCLHIALTAVIINVFDHASMLTSAWLMDMMRISVELLIMYGLVTKKDATPLTLAEIPIFRRLPRTITTAIGWLQIDPSLIYMNCCRSCFALYSLAKTPTWCNYRIRNVPGGPSDPSDANVEIATEIGEAPDVQEEDLKEETCGEPLLRFSRAATILVYD
ncbi:uncharacterized protein MELLADRAFT_108863 [Melampsora larici-populina 98AG31]|uniref:Uncharacterized protein n=1 Tax=Melampsora larici-populina (strain 98AG31 / pathotype 3-4-7) TaxID=747676 RepID=F4RUI5_MELLP|nr:uncharacterized protein MELLADRAFT_108863 [Melampsora larici-populina 98AG31]EGG03942.1 hypothetical protein MELLADRAFT_108863 [Melampsora larici-populina 98AG31]